MPKPKKKRSPHAPPPERKIGRTLVRVFLLIGIWVFIAAFLYVVYCAIDLPDIHQVTQAPRRPSVTVESNDGTVFARYGDLGGDPVTLGTLPPYVPHAIIAIEDRRFYHHFGVDVLGILRALARNVVAGHTVQGGSTLTQQLAKNLFLSPERAMKRKVQEMILAVWLEHTYTKNQILTAYLNRVYLGAGAYGIDAAARIYFDKPARALNIREAAIIAGLLRAPSRYSPMHDPAEAIERAKTVLQAMVEEGYITESERRIALATAPKPARKPGSGGDGRYFADWIYEKTAPMLDDTGQDMIVKTTLDLSTERAAERHIAETLTRQGQARNITQAALVTLAPDGAIRALTGGADYRQSQFNRATQALRQPGSSFKPIVYLAALEDGLKPDEKVLDAPIRIGSYAPENYEGGYRGEITAREALAESVNTVAVRLFERVGPDRVIATARALGITSPLERNAALALGASEVTPLELATVYASLAAGGRAITPYAITEIDSRSGAVLYRHNQVTPPQTVDADAVEALTSMMEEVLRTGTGKAAALGTRPVAGKTGTTSDYKDAWFAGFTADATSVVWMGNDDNDPMKKVTGGSVPAALWHDYMTEIESKFPEKHLKNGASLGAQILDSTGQATEDMSKALGGLIENLIGGKR